MYYFTRRKFENPSFSVNFPLTISHHHHQLPLYHAELATAPLAAANHQKPSDPATSSDHYTDTHMKALLTTSFSSIQKVSDTGILYLVLLYRVFHKCLTDIKYLYL
jgi:hypothetical protein